MFEDEQKMQRLSVGVLIMGVAIVSTAAVLIRLAEAPKLSVAFWRITIAALLLLPVWLRPQRRAAIQALSGQQKWSLIGAGFFLGVHFATWILSLAYTSVAASVLLVTTNPVWVGLMSPWILGERLPRRTWFGIIVALSGTAIVGMDFQSGDFSNPALGNMLALCGAIAMSCYLLFGRRVRPSLDIWTYTSATLLVAWCVLAGTILATQTPIHGFPRQDWLVFTALALGPQLLGHGSLSWVLRYIRAEMVAVALLAEPIGSAVLAWVILSEIPGQGVWFGGPILILGIGVVVLGKRPKGLEKSGRAS